jgi:hypothetical protein
VNPVKPCSYCGRENEDTATHCGGCGTEFAAAADETKPGRLIVPRGLRTFLTIVGVMFLGITLYLLSFGPVLRWTGRIMTTPPPAALTAISTNGTTIVSVTTMSFPLWVGVVYHPAHSLMLGNAGTFSDLYNRYIEWWQKKSP